MMMMMKIVGMTIVKMVIMNYEYVDYEHDNRERGANDDDNDNREEGNDGNEDVEAGFLHHLEEMVVEEEDNMLENVASCNSEAEWSK